MRQSSTGGNYPPGMPGPRSTVVVMTCPNDECVTEVVELAATADLGAVFLDHDEEPVCVRCDWPLVDPTDDPHVLLVPDGTTRPWAEDDGPVPIGPWVLVSHGEIYDWGTFRAMLVAEQVVTLQRAGGHQLGRCRACGGSGKVTPGHQPEDVAPEGLTVNGEPACAYCVGTGQQEVKP